MYNNQKRFKYFATFAVKFLSISDHFAALCIVKLTLTMLFHTGSFYIASDQFETLCIIGLTPTIFTYLNSSKFLLHISLISLKKTNVTDELRILINQLYLGNF